MVGADDRRGKVYDAAVVGLGPNGLRVLTCLALRGFSAIGFDRGLIGETIRQWPMDVPVLGDEAELRVGPDSPSQYCESVECGRDEYLKYLHSVQKRYRIEARENENVIGILRGSEGGFVVTSQRIGERVPRTLSASFVVLAIGTSILPRPLRVRGIELRHVVQVGDVKAAESGKYVGKEVLVDGSGVTAMLLAKVLCSRGAARVVMCTRAENFGTATGIMSAFEREQQEVTSWARLRYKLRSADMANDLAWLRDWRRSYLHDALSHYSSQGLLKVHLRCEVAWLNETHARLRLFPLGRGHRVPRMRTETADLLVASRGFDPDQRLTKSMGFPEKEVDAATGETSIPGVYAIGFDPPGSGTHHYGPLPGGRMVYDNWLCWGNAGAASTCRDIAKKLSVKGHPPSSNGSFEL